jgi:hypothetical protein
LHQWIAENLSADLTAKFCPGSLRDRVAYCPGNDLQDVVISMFLEPLRSLENIRKQLSLAAAQHFFILNENL